MLDVESMKHLRQTAHKFNIPSTYFKLLAQNIDEIFYNPLPYLQPTLTVHLNQLHQEVPR